MVFTANTPYSMVFLSPTGETLIDEIIIIGMDTKVGRCRYRMAHGSAVLTMPHPNDSTIFFSGHGLPLIAGKGTEKGCFHFLGPDPERLYRYLLGYALNMTEAIKSRIRINKVAVELSTYRATLVSDTQKFTVKVVSATGKEGAIAQIMATENCPVSAIRNLTLIKTKRIY